MGLKSDYRAFQENKPGGSRFLREAYEAVRRSAKRFRPTATADQEDIHQGVFQKFLDQISKNKVTASRVEMILERLVIDKISSRIRKDRKEMREVGVGAAQALASIAGRESPVDAELVAADEEKQIKNFRETLSSFDRQVFDLSRQGLRPGQVAKQLGCKEWQVSRAMQRFRKAGRRLDD